MRSVHLPEGALDIACMWMAIPAVMWQFHADLHIEIQRQTSPAKLGNPMDKRGRYQGKWWMHPPILIWVYLKMECIPPKWKQWPWTWLKTEILDTSLLGTKNLFLVCYQTNPCSCPSNKLRLNYPYPVDWLTFWRHLNSVQNPSLIPFNPVFF